MSASVGRDGWDGRDVVGRGGPFGRLRPRVSDRERSVVQVPPVVTGPRPRFDRAGRGVDPSDPREPEPIGVGQSLADRVVDLVARLCPDDRSIDRPDRLVDPVQLGEPFVLVLELPVLTAEPGFPTDAVEGRLRGRREQVRELACHAVERADRLRSGDEHAVVPQRNVGHAPEFGRPVGEAVVPVDVVEHERLLLDETVSGERVAVGVNRRQGTVERRHRRRAGGGPELVGVDVEQVHRARIEVQHARHVVEESPSDLLVRAGVREVPGRLLKGCQGLLAPFAGGDVPTAVEELAVLDRDLPNVDEERVLAPRLVGHRTLDVLEDALVGQFLAVEEARAEQLVDRPPLADLRGGVAEDEVDVGTDVGELAVLVRHQDGVGHVVEGDPVELLRPAEVAFEFDLVRDVDALDHDGSDLAAVALDGPDGQLDRPAVRRVGRREDDGGPEAAVERVLHEPSDVGTGRRRIGPPGERPERLADDRLDPLRPRCVARFVGVDPRVAAARFVGAGSVIEADHRPRGSVGPRQRPVRIQHPRRRLRVVEHGVELSRPLPSGRGSAGGTKRVRGPIQKPTHRVPDRVVDRDVPAHAGRDRLAGEPFVAVGHPEDHRKGLVVRPNLPQELDPRPVGKRPLGDQTVRRSVTDRFERPVDGPNRPYRCVHSPFEGVAEWVEPAGRSDEEETRGLRVVSHFVRPPIPRSRHPSIPPSYAKRRPRTPALRGRPLPSGHRSTRWIMGSVSNPLG